MKKSISGYVRSFNTGDVFLINIMGYSLGLALCSNPPFIGQNGPSASIWLIVILGTIIAVCNGLLYGWFGTVYPCAGGDYVFISRSFSNRIAKITGIGFLASFGFTICQLYGLSSNLQLIPEMALKPCFKSLGLCLEISQTYYQYLPFILCLVYFIIIIINSRIHPILKRFFIWAFFICGILGPIIMIYSFYTTSTDSFIKAYNEYMNNPEAYNGVICASSHSNDRFWHDIINALPLGFLCFMGFTYSVYSGSEVSNPKKSQMKGILLALFVGFITFLFGMTAYVNMVGQEFHANICQASNSEFSLQTAASLIIENQYLNILMNIGITIWWIAVPYVMFQVCIHNFVAWTVDDIFPERFLRLWHGVHVYCAALVLLLTEIILFLVITSNDKISLTNAVALASITFFLVGLCAIRLKPDSLVYKRLPELAKKNVLIPGWSLIKVLGCVCVLAFALFIGKAILEPERGSVCSAISWTIGVYVTGFIYYRLRMNFLQKKRENSGPVNFDPDFFSEIPDDFHENESD